MLAVIEYKVCNCMYIYLVSMLKIIGLSSKAHLPSVKHLAGLSLIKLLCFKDFDGLVFSFLLSTNLALLPTMNGCRELEYKGQSDREAVS
jgi:hypothetical protein